MNKIYLKCGKHVVGIWWHFIMWAGASSSSSFAALLPSSSSHSSHSFIVIVCSLRSYAHTRCIRIIWPYDFWRQPTWVSEWVCSTMRLHVLREFCRRAPAERWHIYYTATYRWYVHLNSRSMHFYFLCHSCVAAVFRRPWVCVCVCSSFILDI